LDPHQFKMKTTIRSLTDADLPIIKPRLAEVFQSINMSNEAIWEIIKKHNPALSVVAEVDGKVAGFYFLGNSPIPEVCDKAKALKHLQPLEGIALGIFEEYRNMGIGRLLIDYPRSIEGVDYIWGYQLKSLENLHHWMKRRSLYFENESYYITCEVFKKNGNKER
jgi:GNAT superfamily N-acetyltransferase